jgi:hypothetical protein
MVFLLRHLTFLVALAVGAFTVGRRLLGQLRFDSPAEELALATALGLGVFSHLLFALGALGQLYPGRVIVALALLVAACARRELVPRVRRSRTLAIAVGAFAILWLLTLYPSTSRAWDASSYHLPIAAGYVTQHRIEPAWALRYPVFSHAQELLFTLALLFGDDLDAQAIQALLAGVTALALFAAGRRLSPQAGPWAVALLLASPLVLWLASSAYVDLGLAAFVTLAVLAIDRFLDEGSTRWLVLAAAFAGFAASSKYTGLFFVGALALFLVERVIAGRAQPRQLALYVAVALLVSAPWYVSSWQWVGDPVFPFGGVLFARGPWSADDLTRQLASMRSHGAGRSLGALVLLPLRLAFQQRPFFPEQAVSPLLFLALVPAVALARSEPCVRRWLYVIGGWLVFWFATVQMYRYLVPILPLAALAGAVGLSRLAALVGDRRGRRVAPVAALLVAQGALWAGWELVQRGAPPATEAARDRWLAARMPAYHAVRFAARAAGGARLYQLDLEDYVRYAGDGVIGDWFGPYRYARLLERSDEPAAFVDELARTGARWLVAPLPAFRAGVFVPTSARLVERYRDDAAAVYEVISAAPAPAPHS